MKKILLIFLSVFVFVSVHAEITWELSDDGTLTISGTDMPNYRFSDSTPWSSQRAKIKKVEIKDGVVNIGVNAFSNCNNVTYVTIPNSVTSIGHSAFYNCYSLTSVTIPNSVTSIGNYAFYGCSGLTSVTIPNSVTSIGNYAFSNCSSLNSADISSSVMSIGDRTFYACSRLKSIIIPNSVTSIGVSAFEDCSLISSVSIGSNVTQIGSSAFRNCNSLKNAEFANIETLCKIKFEDQLSNPLTYAHNLYIGGKIITNAIIPNSVTNIEDYTFYGCSGLTSITIPGSVTSIGNYAFYNCSGLTSVTIPQSVSSIGEYAFYGCSSLASIKFESSKLICKKESLNNLKSLKKVCVNRIEDYLNINFDETSLGNYNNQYSLALHINDQPVSELYIPEGTVSISRSAFSYFRGIKSIHIPSTLKEFGPSAFYGSGIQKVYIKDLYQWCNIDFRGNGGGSNPIYYSNASLYLDDELVETLYIPEGIKSLSDYLFTCCSSIKKVVLPSTLEKIGEWTFDATLKLKEVVCLADNPPSISSYSFNPTFPI